MKLQQITINSFLLIALYCVFILCTRGILFAQDNECANLQDTNAAIDCFNENEHYQELIDYLKQVIADTEDLQLKEDLMIDLAIAYYNAGNNFWAIRTLNNLLDSPDYSCHAHALIAWWQINAGNFREANHLLQNECFQEAGTANNTRYLLMTDFINLNSETDEPALSGDLFNQRRLNIFREDVPLLRTIKSLNNIMPQNLLSLSLTADMGFSTNPYLTSDLDENLTGDNYLPLWKINLGLESTPLQINGHELFLGLTVARNRYYTNFDDFGVDRNISGWNGKLKLGYIAPVLSELKTEYSYSAINLEGGDQYMTGPYWFRESHNLDVYLSFKKGLTLFNEIEYSTFRYDSRTRFRYGLGTIKSWNMQPITVFIVAGTEIHAAKVDGYDLVNLKAIPGMLINFKNLKIELRTLLFFDYYYKSEGYYGGEEKRVDFELSAFLGASYTFPYDLKAKLSYEVHRVFSNILTYDSVEHRLVLSVSYEFNWLRQSEVIHESPLSGRIEIGSSLSEENLPELEEILKRDEIMQRGSSCLSR